MAGGLGLKCLTHPARPLAERESMPGPKENQ